MTWEQAMAEAERVIREGRFTCDSETDVFKLNVWFVIYYCDADNGFYLMETDSRGQIIPQTTRPIVIKGE
jgi:hypothetical protein